MDEVENFVLPISKSLDQGWVVIPQNVKKVKITAPYYRACMAESILWKRVLGSLNVRFLGSLNVYKYGL
jgi:hypothetical protein